MKKSKEIEEIGTAISECLTKLYETKEPLSFNPFPKMYHPTEDLFLELASHQTPILNEMTTNPTHIGSGRSDSTTVETETKMMSF